MSPEVDQREGARRRLLQAAVGVVEQVLQLARELHERERARPAPSAAASPAGSGPASFAAHLHRRAVHRAGVLHRDLRQIGPDRHLRRRASTARRCPPRSPVKRTFAVGVPGLDREVDRLLAAHRDVDRLRRRLLDLHRPLRREADLDRPRLPGVVAHRHRHLQRLAEREDARQGGQEHQRIAHPGEAERRAEAVAVDRHRHDPQRALELRHLEGDLGVAVGVRRHAGRTRRPPAARAGCPPCARTGPSPPPPRRRRAAGS